MTVTPGTRNGKAGEQQTHARHVAVVLAGLVGGAHEDLVHGTGIEPVALHGRPEDTRGEIIGPSAGQHPGVAADGGSQSVDDDGVRGHGR